jgi:O-acetyl-ADP-ribose deacetylase
VKCQDIITDKVEAITNAANSYLSHGGGLAAMIVKEAGYQVVQDSINWLRLYTEVKAGTAAITIPGRLKDQGIKQIIHAVGP